MQLHLETDELNLLANILLERVGTISAQASSSGSPQSDGNLGQGPRFFDDILDKVLARDLRLDSDELEGVANLLRAQKRKLTEAIAHPAAGEREQVLLHARRKAVVAELNQQVVRAANRVALGMGKRIPNIVVRKVEVATQAERQFPIAGIVELPQHFGVTVAIVGELVIAVRRYAH